MEELIRYFIPGSIIILPLYLSLRIIFSVQLNSNSEILAIATVLSPTFGYIIQSIHMYVHEIYFNHSLQRPMIKHIVQKYKEETQIDINPFQAFIAWDYFYYDKLEEGPRLHQRRSWDFAHSSKAVSYSFYSGAFICFITILSLWYKMNINVMDQNLTIVGIMLALCLGFGLFFNKKFFNILTIVINPSEILSVEIHWEFIKKRIEAIIEKK